MVELIFRTDIQEWIQEASKVAFPPVRGAGYEPDLSDQSQREAQSTCCPLHTVYLTILWASRSSRRGLILRITTELHEL